MFRRIVTKGKIIIGLISIGLGLAHWVQANTIVPAEMDYCGMRLHFTPTLQQELQKKVDHITKNILLTKAMAERADIYMPFVEDAFRHIGVPEDLKYIVIQESGLKGDAVSSSNAVGFWQFKDFTGKEVGLEINERVDERMHIFRASIGAARYFYKQYTRFNNWVYAVIAYYAGGTGALPFTNAEYYGVREFVLDENLHWYVQKAIAHKIAYEPLLKQTTKPTVWLEPRPTDGETAAAQLAANNRLDFEEFRRYNLWVRTGDLPPDKSYSYYVPHYDKAYAFVRDPFIHLYPTPASLPPPSKALAIHKHQIEKNKEDAEQYLHLFTKRKNFSLPTKEKEYLEYYIEKEQYYQKDFILATEQYNIIDIAHDYHKSMRKLRRWNKLANEQNPEPNTFLLLVPPRKARVHIARKHETLIDVAIKYKKNALHLMQLNRLESQEQHLVEGQKIYLREPRPEKEPVIVYILEKPFELPAPIASVVDTSAPQSQSTPPTINPTSQTTTIVRTTTIRTVEQPPVVPKPKPIETANGIYHIVEPGETLWGIAKKYNTSVEVIKENNKLGEKSIRIGDKLLVQAKK